MNYWITTHWPPHVIDFGPDPFYYGVWVQDGLDHVAANIKPGDLVFKYESLTGRSRKMPRPDGSIETQTCERGHMGIVAIMVVTSLLCDEKNAATEYEDGSKARWRYHATAAGHDTKGFVSVAQLNALLGFAPKYRMRGFGAAHSGLMQIDKAMYDRIYAVFKSGTPVV